MQINKGTEAAEELFEELRKNGLLAREGAFDASQSCLDLYWKISDKLSEKIYKISI